ncbi:MAG: tetratricopeptide repeat protein [Bacteriovoracaceae bacterium]
MKIPLKNLMLAPLVLLLVSCAGVKNTSEIKLTDIACDSQNYKKSLPLFTAKVMEAPEASAPLYELARCYYESDDFHRSLYYLDLALKKENKSQYFTLKGNSLFHLGRLDQSVTSFQQALKMEPGNSWASMNLGMTFFSQGKYKQAEEMWNSVSDSDMKKHPSFLLSIYRMSLIKNDKTKIISGFENLPKPLQEQFSWKFPYIQEVISSKNDEEKKAIFDDLRKLAGNKPQNLTQIDELTKKYPIRSIAAEK